MKLDVKKFDAVLDEAWQGRTEPLDEASATELMRQMMNGSSNARCVAS